MVSEAVACRIDLFIGTGTDCFMTSFRLSDSKEAQPMGYSDYYKPRFDVKEALCVSFIMSDMIPL